MVTGRYYSRISKLAVVPAVTAIVLTGATAPASAATAVSPGISWSSIWDWILHGTPSLNLPGQQQGTARGVPHYVSAAATQANRGSGFRPGKGRGQLPLFSRHAAAPHPVVTGPDIGNGANSFNPLTSKPVMAKATAMSTLYRNADGTFTRHLYTGQVNYRTADGAWHAINTALARGADGRVHETANSLAVSLAPTAASSSLVSVGSGPAEQVSLGLAGAAPVRAELSRFSATYPSVLPDTDLVLATVASGLTESLVLHSATAPSSWVFPMILHGLTPKLDAAGGIDLVTAAGAVMARIPPAYMHDSNYNKKSGLPASSAAISYQLTNVGGRPALVMTASRGWLTDPARVYPVTVDPNFTTSGTTKVLSDSTGDYSAWDDLDVGTWDNGGEIGRSFMAFSGLGSYLAGDHITAASLYMWDYWASSCTAEPFYIAPITTSWSVTGSKAYPGPSMGSSIGSATYTPSSSQCISNTSGNTTVGGWMPVTLSTGTFNSWTTGGADYGLGAYAGTSGDLTWKRFDSYNTSHPPYLALTYTADQPPQVNSQYPPDNFNSPTLTPELIASGSDPDNWPSSITYNFTVYSSTGSVLASSGNISAGRWVVPAGKLSWAQTYYWTVQTYDGFDYSANPAAFYFTTQVPQPLITSTLAQNSSGHGFDQNVGNYTMSVTDANVQTAGPSLSVDRDYNSLDPRVAGAFGAGWSSLYDLKATEVDDASGAITSVVITYPDGSEVGFGDNNGTFTAPLGRYATLTALANHAGYTLTDKNDTTYTFDQAVSSNVFAISSISDYENRTETFTYTSGQLSTVTSGVSGRALHFTWSTPSGAQYPHVASVSTDPATAGQPSTALTWTYGYSGDSLTSVCPPTSPANCTGYTYATGSHFPTAVLDAGPAAYWRLDEASGTTAGDSVLPNEDLYNGTYSNVTLGQPGPLPGSGATAASFNGTSSYMQLPSSLAANASYLTGSYLTISLWFKTSSDNGILFASTTNPISAGTTSGGYVPNLYVGSDGKLNGELWGSSGPMVSASSVADGHWHYVVLTGAGSTESMYLDGALAGSQTAQVGVSGQPNVYVGAGFIGGNWPDESHHLQNGNTGYAQYFTGSISDVALYGQYLTAPSVQELYATGHSAVGLLDKSTTPSGNVTAQISYSDVTDRVTSMTDSNGGTWAIGAPTVTGTSQVYRSAVLGADPAGYWRLNDTGGATTATDQVLGGTGSYNTVTLGVTGPFSDTTAASFNGTSSYVQLPSSDSPGTGPASVGLWFMVPKGNTAGGVLYDYEMYPLNYSGMPTGQWDPALYVGTDGKLRGEFWNGSASPITTSGTVNDGNWHYAVLAATSAGQSLYLDGKLAGNSSTALAASSGNYVYVGAGESHSWPSGPTNNLGYFPGSIAEIAFYKSQLSASQVLTQWLAAKSSRGLAPTETITVTDPGSKTLSYSYDPMEGDRLVAETDGLGNVTKYGYDTSGFLYTTTQPNGNVITTGHDVRGNLVSQTTCQDQAANQCSTEYYTYYPDDTTTKLTSDPRNDLVLTLRDGRSSSATDNRYLTTYAYDAAGNQTSATTPPVPGFPDGRTTALVYTTSTTPAAGGGSTPAGLLASATTPGGATETISYYSDGDVASVTDPAGEVTKYGYDALGRVLTKTVISNSYPNGLVTSYGYDGAGHVLTETDPAVTDQVTGATHTPQTTNSYDLDGNLTTVTVADTTGGDASRTTTYAYNSHDKMRSKTDALANTTSFTYDAYGNEVTQTDPLGNVTDYAYDANGHLLTVDLPGYTGDPVNPSTATNLVEQSRAYDPDGRLASVTDSMGRQTSYTYTDNGLLATVTRSNPATGQSFTQQSDYYDAAGNLVRRVTNNGTSTTTYTVDAADRIASSTIDPSGLDRTTTYTYSPDDFPITTAVTSNGTVASVIDNTYDPLGRTTSTSVHDDTAGHPVGWWPLSDGAAASASYDPTFAADVSGAGNTAIRSSGAAWTSSSASFNGSSGLLATSGPVLNTSTQSYSVSAWVNLASTSTTGGFDAVSQSGTNGPSFELQYSGGYGGWSFTTTSTDSATPTYYGAHLSTAPALNTWTHLVGVFDSGNDSLSLYVDGSLAATATASTPWTGTGPLAIGGDRTASGGTSHIFNGQVADVQVYQHALSASDVSALYGYGPAVGAIDARRLTSTITLDQRGLPTAMTDPDHNTTTFSYDEAGKQAQIVEPAINAEADGSTAAPTTPIISYGYDTFGEQVKTENPNGGITTVNYDADGRPVSRTLPPYFPPGSTTPITATTSQAYDGIGEVTSSTDALGNLTSYLYDQLGDVAEVTQPGGASTHYSYDTNGEQTSVTNQVGAQTQTTWDFLGRQLTSTQIVRQPSTTAYTTTNDYADTAGYRSSVTSPDGVITSYAYDAAGEPTSVTDGAGDSTTYGYDALGRRTVITLPDGTSQHVSYDEAGNTVGFSNENASGAPQRSTSATFDANGNMTSSTDAMGYTTSYTYNALGLPTEQVQPVSSSSNIVNTFGYDAAGNRTRYTDGNGNATIYTYNSWNLPESTILPATTAYPNLSDRTFTVSYDAAAHPVAQTSPGGVAVTAAYDTNGNLTSQSGTGADAATATRTFGYDAAGELISASVPASSSTPAGTDSFSYDDRGLLLSASGPSGTSSFAYNGDGLMSSQATAAGISTFTYDSAGRLATMGDEVTGAALGYSYTPNSQVKSISYGANSDTRNFTYNALEERTGDTLLDPSGNTIASIAYGYDANGNETSKATTGFSGSSANTYTYDYANRLTSWNDGTSTVSYGYDGAGNRTQVGSQTFSYDARNELISGKGNSYTYTPRGTLASVTNSSGTTTNLTFDAFNELITQGSQTLTYDSLGRLVENQGTALTYYGMTNNVATDGGYAYSRDPHGDVIGLKSTPNPLLGIASFSALVMTDQHKDVVGTFAAAGTALGSSASYDPLGNVTAGGAFGNLGYQSGWTDPATSNVNMDSRWYNAATGQFLSKDAASNSPIPNSVNANAFAYGNDNPLTQYDLLGTCSGFFCAVGNFFSNVGNTAHNAWNSVTSTVSNIGNSVGQGWNDFSRGFRNFMSQARNVLTRVVTRAVHTYYIVAHKIQDAYNTVRKTIGSAYNYVASTATHVVAATYHAVKYAATTATQFVQHHAAAIVSFVASTAVFIGCEAAVSALTAGVASLPGAVGCSALAGAVGNAVSYAMTTPTSKWSLGDFAKTTLEGAATGAAAGFLGSLGSELLGPVVDAVASRLGPAVVDDAADAAASVADSAAGDTASAASDAGSAGSGAASADAGSAPSAADPSPESTPSEPSTSADQATSCDVNSFTGATRVLLASGRAVAIDKLRAGQKVLATDPYRNLSGTRRIAKVITHSGPHTMVAVTLLGGMTIRATDHHPFWDATTGTFTYADALRAGDKLRTPSGHLVVIRHVRGYQADLTAYNLSISGIHTYYVLAGRTPVLVHNSCGQTGDSQGQAAQGNGEPSNVPEGGKLPDRIAKNFTGGHYTTSTLQEDTVFYRAGVKENPWGQYFSSERPVGVIQTRIDKAIPYAWDDGTPALLDTGYAIKVPAGTTIYSGEVANQGGIFMGGTGQIFIFKPWEIPGAEVIDSWPLR
ncbi:MAG TPA: LamG-like jellyroll fold domain-containing protein [Streptosporangiaceae bacterium]|nr:LamG-like jellyroll fold domain-containing protein [Streptosporangiaceae bacterium]